MSLSGLFIECSFAFFAKAQRTGGPQKTVWRATCGPRGIGLHYFIDFCHLNPHLDKDNELTVRAAGCLCKTLFLHKYLPWTQKLLAQLERAVQNPTI